MIIVTPHDWSYDLQPDENQAPAFVPMLHEPLPERSSCVLGPDGEPVTIAVPRYRMGFDLTPRRGR